MSEDNNPLKEAFKTFAGVSGQEEIEDVRSKDLDDSGLENVQVPESTVPSAEALDDDGVIDHSSAQVGGGGEQE